MFNEDYDDLLIEDEEDLRYEYESAIEELDELGLDDTAYDYYRSCLEDMFYNDLISVKNGPVGYPDIESILTDAKNTANQ